MKKSLTACVLAFAGLIGVNHVYASYDTTLSCTQGYGYIDGVAYSDAEFMPIIHIKNGSWAYLAWSQGLNTYYGRAMLSVALTAYTTGRKVWIGCKSSDNANQLWLYP
ncbi:MULTISPECIES: hypothetical protein [pseudomallei group]|uniref:hypothetical protein n=1 Tax=pseudomallei group TaxID=111527 RepID=UPI0005154B24|nr:MULTISPECIES: hypothetical protein [pseudomallei group]AIS96073.1 hypothetical protein BTHA_2214 [Burkholderia thailandensis MSMB59]NVH70114.1 hypothetical protein [Burkholderia pseudomallei]